MFNVDNGLYRWYMIRYMIDVRKYGIDLFVR